MTRLTTTVKRLLIGLFAAYVLQLILTNFVGVNLAPWLALLPSSPLPWQVVTYVLVEGGHALLFLLGLWMIGISFSDFERMCGRDRLWQLALVGALSASIPVLILGSVFAPVHALAGNTPLWYCGFATTAWLDRHRPISLFGVVPMTQQQFLLLLVGFSVLSFLQTVSYTQLVADLGALGGGIAYANWLRRPKKPRSAARPPKRGNPRGLRVIPGGQDDDKPRWIN